MIGRARARRILLTGATSGIGLELARRWAPHHEVMVTGRTLPDELADLCEHIPGLHYVKADFAKPAQAADTVLDALQTAGGRELDNVVLNHGMGHAGDPASEPFEAIADTFAVNLTSAMLLAHGLRPHLEKARGTLTLIGSTAHKGAPLFASYAASKAGLNGFARSLREEWRGRIYVQIIHPGPTRTAMHQKAGHDPGALGRLFIPPAAMAAMIDNVIARRYPRRTLSFMHYWGGEALKARGLR